MPGFMPEALEIMTSIDDWAKAHQVPREAIIRQIPIAYMWTRSNKKRAPKKNIMRFLDNWFKRAKEHHNLTSQQPVHKYVDNVPEEDMSIDEMIAIRKRNFR